MRHTTFTMPASLTADFLRAIFLLLCLQRYSTFASDFVRRWKIYAAGSGLGMFSLPETVREILDLAGLDRPANVLYLGTATYDAPDPERAQTLRFVEMGCNVTSLRISWRDSPPGGRSAMRAAFDAADVLVVSGGNTLYAVDRFRKLGIDAEIRRAADRGVVLAGGSAGAIVWFDGGHSDSMKPGSFKNPPGPLLRPDLTPEEWSKDWTYVRVPGLGMLPGLLCPHYDKIGENGTPRAEDFNGMVRRHPGERAIGVDNWAAIIIDGDQYSVISRNGKSGSVGPDGKFSSNRTLGRPGVWRIHLSNISQHGTVIRELIPETGAMSDLFQPAQFIEPFEGMLKVAREQNPDDGMPAVWLTTAATDASISSVISVLLIIGLVVTAALAVLVRNKRRSSANATAPHDELSKLTSLEHNNARETALA